MHVVESFIVVAIAITVILSIGQMIITALMIGAIGIVSGIVWIGQTSWGLITGQKRLS